MEKIYKEYFDIVNKYLFSLTNNSDISEELTQETFYRAVKSIDSYNGKCKMSVWLCQIAKNLWYNQCKKNKRIVNVKDTQLSNIPEILSLTKKKKYLYIKKCNI